VRLESPLVGEWRGGPSRHRVRPSPRTGPRAVGMPYLVLFVSSEGSVSRDISDDLFICDVPSVRPTEPLARG
jgi:hypothetical protein